jgi:hypothetical protein
MNQKNNKVELPNIQEQIIMVYAMIVKSIEVSVRFQTSFLALLKKLEDQGLVSKDEIEKEGLDMGKDIINQLDMNSRDIDFMSKMVQVINYREENKEDN